MWEVKTVQLQEQLLRMCEVRTMQLKAKDALVGLSVCPCAPAVADCVAAGPHGGDPLAQDPRRACDVILEGAIVAVLCAAAQLCGTQS
jgi:hypothetical protein